MQGSTIIMWHFIELSFTVLTFFSQLFSLGQSRLLFYSCFSSCFKNQPPLVVQHSLPHRLCCCATWTSLPIHLISWMWNSLFTVSWRSYFPTTASEYLFSRGWRSVPSGFSFLLDFTSHHWSVLLHTQKELPASLTLSIHTTFTIVQH